MPFTKTRARTSQTDDAYVRIDRVSDGAIVWVDFDSIHALRITSPVGPEIVMVMAIPVVGQGHTTVPQTITMTGQDAQDMIDRLTVLQVGHLAGEWVDSTT